MKRRIAVRAIIMDGDKLLCVKIKKPFKAEGVSDYWCLPGGGVEDGEALLPALEREMIEELGVKPVTGALLYIQQFVAADMEHLEFFFHVTNTDDYRQIDLAKTSHGELEIAAVDFINPTTNYVLPKFLETESLVEHISNHESVKLYSFL